MTHLRTSIGVLLILSLAACGDDRHGPPDAATPDDGGGSDAGGLDSGEPGLPGTIAGRAAARLGSCASDESVGEWLATLYYVRHDHPVVGDDELSCLAMASDGCPAIDRCLGIRTETVGACTAEARCVDNELHVCADGVERIRSCERRGLICADAECQSGTGEACDIDTFADACTGDVPTYCAGGEPTVRTGPGCEELGLQCLVEDGSVACRGTGPACEPDRITPGRVTYDQGLRCEAAGLVACVNGHESTVGCGGLAEGFSCQAVGGTAFCGRGAECDPLDGASATCDGGSLAFCNAGRLDRVDCRSLGFTSCDLGRCR